MDWDQRYKEDDKPWDKGTATPVLFELSEKASTYFKPGFKTLVPGCGLGHDVALLRILGLEAYGLDISETALNTAKELYSDLGDVWIIDDLFQLKDKDGSYDLIWEHTCYCAILPEQRTDYIKNMLRILKPGAYFAGVFFLDTGQAPDVGPPFSTTKDDVIQLFAPYFELIWEAKPNQSYPGRENREHAIIWRKPTRS